MSKAVRTIVSVAAAVAIPFAAPAIAGSLGALTGLSAGTFGLSAAAGSTIGSALTGAALGATKGAILGEDITRSALMGGIGGGLYGYAGAPTATPANVGPAGYVPGGTAGAFGPASAYAPVDAASSFPLTGDLGTAAAFSPSVDTAGYVSGGTAGTFGAPPVDQAASGTGLSSAFSAPTTTPPPVAVQPPPVAGLKPPETFGEALRQVPGKITERFSNPEKLADLTLRAAGQLAGSAFATEGLSDEERAMINAQAEELRGLQQTNRNLFNQRLEQAQSLAGESRYFDPEYFGLQGARRAQITGARAKQAGLRGLVGDRREAESRRFDLATGRDTGTAYDVGFRTGLGGRLQTQTAGLNAMPGYMDYRTPATTALMAGQAADRARRKEEEAGISQLFGSVTGRS